MTLLFVIFLRLIQPHSKLMAPLCLYQSCGKLLQMLLANHCVAFTVKQPQKMQLLPPETIGIRNQHGLKY